MTSQRDLTIVVPTVGLSPHLNACLEALASARAEGAKVLLVSQDTDNRQAKSSMAIDRLIEMPPGCGFAHACNRAFADVETPFVAVINDDAIVTSEWSADLLATLKSEPGAGSAQGLNLSMAQNGIIDGCGIGWTNAWQAIQIGHGEPEGKCLESREVFGVSGTAALYRCSALRRAAVGRDRPFDEILHTYYEDVDLACRLRAIGSAALFVRSARAHHAGAASSRTRPVWRYRHVYGNRWLVLARLLGEALKSEVGRILRRDLLDLGTALATLDPHKMVGITRGWQRARCLIPKYRHEGPPLVPLSELRVFQSKLEATGSS